MNDELKAKINSSVYNLNKKIVRKASKRLRRRLETGNLFKEIANDDLWCNGYRCRKWIRRLEFKSWTTLFEFLITVEKI